LLHVQLVRSMLPAPEYVLEGQSLHVAWKVADIAVLYLPCEHSVQAVEPLTSLYVPATHATHPAPSSPEKPVGQEQLMRRKLPGFE
jgi:hypothetical protein